jgi:hypothetical protein
MLKNKIEKFLYVEKHSCAEADGHGNIIKPAQTYKYRRFKFRRPYGLYVLQGFRYMAAPHWALFNFKWNSRSAWCHLRYRGHNWVGPIGSCSRCGMN